jgi:hypothetical protein
MCLVPSAKQVTDQTPQPVTPPPPQAPLAPELPQDSTATNARSTASARKQLRVDLAAPRTSGLNIPV